MVVETRRTLSKKTKCIRGCHLIVNLELEGDRWYCPICGKAYLIKHWVIKEDVKLSSKITREEINVGISKN